MKKVKIANDYTRKISNKKFYRRKKLNKKAHKFKKKQKKTHTIIYILFFIIIILLISFLSFLGILLKRRNSKLMKNNFNNYKNVFNLSYYENKIKELQSDSILWPLPSELRFIPMMSYVELKAFSSFLKPEKIYFEFGSGGSTNLASYYKLNKIYSVESDVNWHNKIKSLNLPGIIYLTVDLNSKNDFGHPGNGTTVEDWKKYIQAYKAEYNADIILIDGRFRVACGLDIFSKIRDDTVVLIHDYTNRDEYHILEDFYIKVKSWDSLAAFFKRTNVTSIPEDIYNKYIYIQGL